MRMVLGRLQRSGWTLNTQPLPLPDAVWPASADEAPSPCHTQPGPPSRTGPRFARSRRPSSVRQPPLNSALLRGGDLGAREGINRSTGSVPYLLLFPHHKLSWLSNPQRVGCKRLYLNVYAHKGNPSFYLTHDPSCLLIMVAYHFCWLGVFCS